MINNYWSTVYGISLSKALKEYLEDGRIGRYMVMDTQGCKEFEYFEDEHTAAIEFLTEKYWFEDMVFVVNFRSLERAQIASDEIVEQLGGNYNDMHVIDLKGVLYFLRKKYCGKKPVIKNKDITLLKSAYSRRPIRDVFEDYLEGKENRYFVVDIGCYTNKIDTDVFEYRGSYVDVPVEEDLDESCIVSVWRDKSEAEDWAEQKNSEDVHEHDFNKLIVFDFEVVRRYLCKKYRGNK